MSIQALPASEYISGYSAKAVQDFLRPQSTLDRIYLIALMIWFISSIIFSQEAMYRVLSFIVMIIILILNNLDKKVTRKNLTLMGSAIKLFIMYLLISFITGNKPVDIPFSLSEDFTYLDIENIIIIGVFIFAIILNSLQFYLIKYYEIKGYQAFIRSLVRGLWLIGITIFILISLDLLVEEIAEKILWEEFLLSSFMLYLISSLLPFTVNPITNSIIKRNSLLSLRDCTLGASLTLILLNIIFNKLTFTIWNSILPLFFIVSLILYFLGMEKMKINDELIIKSLNHTKEMANKIAKLEFNEPEEAFIVSKSIEILKQSTAKLTSKNSLIVPLSFTEDSVAIEVVGNLILETKDSIGRIKKESIEKSTFVLSKAEWNKLSKKLKPKKLSNIKLADYMINYQSKDELIDSFRNSLTQYKNLSNIEGFSKLQQKLQSIKNNSNIEVNDSRKEYNFPGIKFIEDRDSELVKIGPIQSIEIKKEVPGSKKKAKYFGIKMPFVSSAEVDHNGKFFILEMPFVSVLESPKGMIMKLFGFEVVEGNKGKILEDLHRMLNVQAKFENYFQLKMSNMLVVEKNPKFILTKGINEEEPNLLMSGAEDSFYIKQKQDIPLLEQQSEISQEAFKSEIKGDIIELSEDVIEVVIEDNDKELATPNLNFSKEEKLNKLARRIDMMDIDEFSEYMGFQNKKDFLDWLLTLPNESKIRIEGNIIYFK